MDLGYSIHGFSYYKSMTKTRTVTITDRYEFKKEEKYNGIAATAVDNMYQAMNAGAIIPFKMEMALSLNKKVIVGESYSNYVFLGKGESIDYYLTLNRNSDYEIKMLLTKNVKFEAYDAYPVVNVLFDIGNELLISATKHRNIKLCITNSYDKNATYFLMINAIK